jgi:hypothetical protein
MKTILKPTDLAFDIAKEITTKIATQPSEDRQIQSSIAPIISNSIFERDKDIIENERWRTVKALALALPFGESFDLAINTLGYKITI